MAKKVYRLYTSTAREVPAEDEDEPLQIYDLTISLFEN